MGFGLIIFWLDEQRRCVRTNRMGDSRTGLFHRYWRLRGLSMNFLRLSYSANAFTYSWINTGGHLEVLKAGMTACYFKKNKSFNAHTSEWGTCGSTSSWKLSLGLVPTLSLQDCMYSSKPRELDQESNWKWSTTDMQVLHPVEVQGPGTPIPVSARPTRMKFRERISICLGIEKQKRKEKEEKKESKSEYLCLFLIFYLARVHT